MGQDRIKASDREAKQMNAQLEEQNELLKRHVEIISAQ